MILDEIGAYLQANSIGTVGTDIFKGSMPNTPVVQIGLYEYQGLPSIDASGGIAAERPRFQVIVRGPAYEAARTTAEAIHTLLNRTSFTQSGTAYLFVKAIAPPFKIGVDANNNVKIGISFQVTKETS